MQYVSQEEIDRAISESIGGNAISELMGSLFTEVGKTWQQVQILRV
jgi:hypothetical protein